LRVVSHCVIHAPWRSANLIPVVGNPVVGNPADIAIYVSTLQFEFGRANASAVGVWRDRPPSSKWLDRLQRGDR